MHCPAPRSYQLSTAKSPRLPKTPKQKPKQTPTRLVIRVSYHFLTGRERRRRRKKRKKEKKDKKKRKRKGTRRYTGNTVGYIPPRLTDLTLPYLPQSYDTYQANQSEVKQKKIKGQFVVFLFFFYNNIIISEFIVCKRVLYSSMILGYKKKKKLFLFS